MSRLIKGEIAKSIQGISTAAALSAALRVEEFERLKNDPALSEANLSKFLTVSDLSAWKDDLLGITPLSPKTLRKYINGIYLGGLGQLLRDAANIMEGLRGELNKRAENNSSIWRARTEQAVDSSLEMTARYLDLLERLKKLAMRCEEANVELKRHMSRYESRSHIRVVK